MVRFQTHAQCVIPIPNVRLCVSCVSESVWGVFVCVCVGVWLCVCVGGSVFVVCACGVCVVFVCACCPFV